MIFKNKSETIDFSSDYILTLPVVTLISTVFICISETGTDQNKKNLSQTRDRF